MDELDEHFYCPICRDIFMTPKLYDCGHTICEKCMIKMDETEEEKVISSSQVKNNISLELDTIIQIIRSESDNIKFLDGFTIQLYLGDDRNKAEETEQKISEIDSLIFKNTVFTQPNYRVKIGQYIDRFKVAEEYQRFKKLFPNAIIIPERIKVN